MTDPYRYSDPLNGKTLGQDIRIRDIFDMFEEVEIVRVFSMENQLNGQSPPYRFNGHSAICSGWSAV